MIGIEINFKVFTSGFIRRDKEVLTTKVRVIVRRTLTLKSINQREWFFLLLQLEGGS